MNEIRRGEFPGMLEGQMDEELPQVEESQRGKDMAPRNWANEEGKETEKVSEELPIRPEGLLHLPRI